MKYILLMFTLPSFAFAQLKSYKIDPHSVTVSGVSSGAFMSIQLQIAFSKTFAGAASIAGGPYWCAEGDSNRAIKECLQHPDQIKVGDLVTEAQSLAAQ